MKLIRVGITHGDINGVSLELIAKALSSPELLELCTPIVFSDDTCFLQAASLFEIEQPVPMEVINSADRALDGRVNLVNTCEEKPLIEWGMQTEIALKAEAASLNAAIEAFKAGLIDILICAPGQLDNDIDSHSLSDFVKQAVGSQTSAFNWIMNDNVRLLKMTSVASTTELGEGFAIESFMNDVKTIHSQMREDFGFIRPRIAILMSNEKISNAIHELQDQNITVFGMTSKDFIEAHNQQHYDAILFHEEEEARHQMIQEFEQDKSIGFVSGMPVILTYPIMGVGYDKAGKGISDETSLRNAIYTAIDICRNRYLYRDATRHPLEKQWVPKGRDDFKLDLTKEE